MKKRRFSMVAGALVVLLGGGFWGYTSLKGASVDIDPSKIATVERGTMVRSEPSVRSVRTARSGSRRLVRTAPSASGIRAPQSRNGSFTGVRTG